MTSPRLTTSIPFWALVGGSAVAIAGGAYLLVTTLDVMSTKLLDGTATGVEVYPGQVWGVLGAILIGAGLIGFALALTLGALRSLAPAAAVEVVDAPAWEETDVIVTEVVAEAVPVDVAADAADVATDGVTPEATPTR